MVTKQDIIDGIRSLGLSSSIVCLHSSLKSFGHVEGGADTVVQAFVQEGCTLVVPTYLFDSQVPAPAGRVVARNGGEAEETKGRSLQDAASWNPSSKKIAAGMGAIPQAVLNTPGAVRGDHPLNSISALGPEAKELIAAQEPLDVYGPYRRAYERGGYLLLIGVDLTKATPLHFSEQVAGRNSFRRWALGEDGEILEVEIGSCSNGFGKFDGVVADIEARVRVGESLWRMFPLQEFIDRTSREIVENPQITHCHRPTCLRCDDAVVGGPILPGKH